MGGDRLRWFRRGWFCEEEVRFVCNGEDFFGGITL